jgi:hypothetical protein
MPDTPPALTAKMSDNTDTNVSPQAKALASHVEAISTTKFRSEPKGGCDDGIEKPAAHRCGRTNCRTG